MIDMRETRFAWPAAVLWAATYLHLARLRGSRCTLLVPENMGVCSYLKSTGVFELLRSAGVEIDQLGIMGADVAQAVLPITPLHSEDQVEELANDVLETLSTRNLGSVNLYPVVTEIFAEFANNAVQHPESEISAFAMIQFYQFETERRFICCVADGGIGIRKSLERNPELAGRAPYDWVAIELAMQERTSGTGDPTRGIGLFGVAEEMRRPGRLLIVHSGQGVMHINEEVETQSKRSTLFPGTLAYASIPA